MKPGDLVTSSTRCADCDKPAPQWASLTFAALICLECSGVHRGLGTHISFVRSVQLDKWTEAQLARMQRGGNDRLSRALRLVNDLEIAKKYTSPEAEVYRNALNEECAAAGEWCPAVVVQNDVPVSERQQSFAYTSGQGLSTSPVKKAESWWDVGSDLFGKAGQMAKQGLGELETLASDLNSKSEVWKNVSDVVGKGKELVVEQARQIEKSVKELDDDWFDGLSKDKIKSNRNDM